KLLKAELAEIRYQYNELESLIDSIDASVATIRFSPDGIVEAVNDNFLAVIGYDKSEVIGQHHKIFCDSDYVKSSEYKGFWEDLRQGKKKRARLNVLLKLKTR
ncbi:PAS domain-containing protein, partial [Methylophaga muralis]|uniref:PAS domain-containing protein n=1 Tax=Methylophaga muralis TaxID=291169 RepID=UPI000B0DD805